VDDQQKGFARVEAEAALKLERAALTKGVVAKYAGYIA